MKDNVTLGRMASVWQLSVTNDECVTYSAVVDVHDIIDMCAQVSDVSATETRRALRSTSMF